MVSFNAMMSFFFGVLFKFFKFKCVQLILAYVQRGDFQWKHSKLKFCLIFFHNAHRNDIAQMYHSDISSFGAVAQQQLTCTCWFHTRWSTRCGVIFVFVVFVCVYVIVALGAKSQRLLHQSVQWKSNRKRLKKMPKLFTRSDAVCGQKSYGKCNSEFCI